MIFKNADDIVMLMKPYRAIEILSIHNNVPQYLSSYCAQHALILKHKLSVFNKNHEYHFVLYHVKNPNSFVLLLHSYFILENHT